MTMKVKAVEKKLKFTKDENDPGVYRYVMSPEQYSSLNQKKVIKEAALRSGVSQGVMQACWDAAGEVIKAWATEGHSVALPGLGTMRFGLRSKSVEDVNKVKSSLITSRRIIFTPDVTPCQVCREVGGREVESYFHPTHHLHSRCGLEGRTEGHCRPDYLLRPHW